MVRGLTPLGENMNPVVQQIAALAVGLAAMWLVFVGIAMAVGGPAAAGRVFRWPFRVGFRAARWVVGSSFIALGDLLRYIGQAILP